MYKVIPCIKLVTLLKKADQFSIQHPFEQLIYIRKIIIECRPNNIAVFQQIRDPDL